jgi:hypothetical protein
MSLSAAEAEAAEVKAVEVLPADGALPSGTFVVANFIVSQLCWFACVLGAAQGQPRFGTTCVVVAVIWHLAIVRRPWDELRLVASAVVLGMAFDAAVLSSGAITFPNGQWLLGLSPHWMQAMWAVFAISLNVSLRWLRTRLWLTALIGAVVGPMSFMAGVRLGGAAFVDMPLAMGLLALGWGAAMPALAALSKRFDGVAALQPMKGS